MKNLIVVTGLGLTLAAGVGCANKGSIDPTFTKAVVSSASSKSSVAAAHLDPSSQMAGILAVGDAMPFQLKKLFLAADTSGTTYATSKAVSDPASCATSGSVDGTIFGYACYLDMFIAGLAKTMPNNCSGYAGETANFERMLPVVADWGIPTSFTVNGSSGGSSKLLKLGYFDTSASQQIALVHTKEGDISQVDLGHKNLSTGDFTFIYFRTGDNGSAPSDGSKMNLTAAFGNVTAKRFETYQTYFNSPDYYTVRTRTVGDFVYAQIWHSTTRATAYDVKGDAPADASDTLGAGAGVPTACYDLSTFKVVAKSNCATALGLASTALDDNALHDDLFSMKAFDFDTKMVSKTPSYFDIDTRSYLDSGNRTSDGCF